MKYFKNNLKNLSPEAKKYFNFKSTDTYAIHLFVKSNGIEFAKLVSPKLLDPDFILKYYQKIILETYKKMEPFILEDHQKVIVHLNEVVASSKFLNFDTISGIIKGLNQCATFVVPEDKLNAVIYFNRSFLGACTPAGNVEHDLSQALAHLYPEGQRESRYYTVLGEFKKRLVNDLFEHYPEELIRFKKIRSRNQVKYLLNI
jgi:hypothetical protein